MRAFGLIIVLCGLGLGGLGLWGYQAMAPIMRSEKSLHHPIALTSAQMAFATRSCGYDAAHDAVVGPHRVPAVKTAAAARAAVSFASADVEDYAPLLSGGYGPRMVVRCSLSGGSWASTVYTLRSTSDVPSL